MNPTPVSPLKLAPRNVSPPSFLQTSPRREKEVPAKSPGKKTPAVKISAMETPKNVAEEIDRQREEKQRRLSSQQDAPWMSEVQNRRKSTDITIIEEKGEKLSPWQEEITKKRGSLGVVEPVKQPHRPAKAKAAKKKNSVKKAPPKNSAPVKTTPANVPIKTVPTSPVKVVGRKVSGVNTNKFFEQFSKEESPEISTSKESVQQSSEVIDVAPVLHRSTEVVSGNSDGVALDLAPVLPRDVEIISPRDAKLNSSSEHISVAPVLERSVQVEDKKESSSPTSTASRKSDSSIPAWKQKALFKQQIRNQKLMGLDNDEN